MNQTYEQQRFTISEVAADWHELMIPWRIVRPSIARVPRDSEQLEPWCSPQTYHRPNLATIAGLQSVAVGLSYTTRFHPAGIGG